MPFLILPIRRELTEQVNSLVGCAVEVELGTDVVELGSGFHDVSVSAVGRATIVVLIRHELVCDPTGVAIGSLPNVPVKLCLGARQVDQATAKARLVSRVLCGRHAAQSVPCTSRSCTQTHRSSSLVASWAQPDL